MEVKLGFVVLVKFFIVKKKGIFLLLGSNIVIGWKLMLFFFLKVNVLLVFIVMLLWICFRLVV